MKILKKRSSSQEIIIKQLGYLCENLELIEKYNKNGFRIEFDFLKSMFIINFKGKKYFLKIIEKQNKYYWNLELYSSKIYEKRLYSKRKQFEIILNNIISQKG